MTDIHQGNLSLQDADEEQIHELKDMKGKGKIPLEKRTFLKNSGSLLSTEENILNNIKSKISPTKHPNKKYLLHLNKKIKNCKI